MGNDAAKGVKMVKAAGGYVIAQDEATSMIFGMPAEAIQTGVVDEVLPLDDISAAIEKRVAKLCQLVPVDNAMKSTASKPRTTRSAHAARANRNGRAFHVANQMFAIAADSVQEIRSTDSLAGTASEIEIPELTEGSPHDRPRVTEPTTS